MISLLRAIFNALNEVLAGQDAAAQQAASDLAELNTQLADLSAAVEHLRVLIEDDSIIAVVGVPTFTVTGASA